MIHDFKQAEPRALKSRSLSFNCIGLQSSMTYVSCGFFWMEANLDIIRLWNEERRVAVEDRRNLHHDWFVRRYISDTSLGQPAPNALLLTQVLGLNSVSHRPWAWWLVGLANELGSAGSSGPVRTLTILGMSYLVGSLPTPFRRLFQGFPHGKQGLPGLALAPQQNWVRTHPNILIHGQFRGLRKPWTGRQCWLAGWSKPAHLWSPPLRAAKLYF